VGVHRLRSKGPGQRLGDILAGHDRDGFELEVGPRGDPARP
jgi:hypothetical protein